MGSTNRAAVLALLLWALGSRAQAIDEPAPEPPTAQSEQEAQVLKRAGLTFLGEAIGAALPLVVGELLVNRNTCNPFSGCDITALAVLASFLPLTVGAGGQLGHWLLGGKSGPGFGLAGAAVGYLLGLTFLTFVSIAGGREWSATSPAAGAGALGVLGAIGGVVGYEWRNYELRHGARPWSGSRFTLTTIAFWVPAAATAALLTFALGEARINDGGAVALLAIGGGALIAVASGAAAYGVHRAMGGQAKAVWLIPGLLGGIAAGTLFFASHYWSPVAPGMWRNQDTAVIGPITVIAALIGAAGPAVALEWANARTAPVDEGPNIEEDDRVSVSVAPTRNGAMLGLGVRF